MNVAFLNENTLGHTSYLPRFVEAFRQSPEWGVVPRPIDVAPLPPDWARRADFTVRGLRKVGLDFHVARWRRVVSRYARRQLDALRQAESIDAVVVNTQSVGLFLAEPPLGIPLFVCLDATFQQLARSRWFAMNRMAGWLHPLTLAPILGLERRLYAAATRFLPWAAPVRDSLVSDYGISPEQISVLPPSLDTEVLRPGERRPRSKPQILFLGGDFFRKGGPLLLDVFRREFAGRAELHVITQSDIASEAGVVVHRGVKPQSDAWFERWREADVFVFPSTLETFGIVLIEALSFGVPVVASRAGAAVDILGDGRNGVLMDEVNAACLTEGIRAVLDDPEGAQLRADRGRRRAVRDYDLKRNSETLARWLRAACEPAQAG